LLRLALTVAYGTFLLGRPLVQIGWLRFPVAAFVSALALSVIITFVMQLLILWRVLMPVSQRRCTIKLNAEGFSDVSLRKSKSIPWSAISEIRYRNGDVFFWQKGKDGNFVPRSAFNDPQQSQAFFQTAKGYWEAARLGQPVLVSNDDGVWPPLPRIGG